MKLLFVRQNYPPERGAFRYIYNLATDLARRGHHVTVMTGTPHYPFSTPYPGYSRFFPISKMENGVKVIRLPLIMAANSQPLKRILGFLSFAIVLFPALLICGKPDLFVCSIPPITAGPAVHLVSRLRRIPLIMMLHDFEPLTSASLRDKENFPLVCPPIWKGRGDYCPHYK